eukprot:TRINITY_DN793_c0_g1_i2.p1 TRINITY_DN793_c0_g1~~TRINITY_DN793_c0_g1_i2.p1  ORF type:complete len:249 (-),score=32.85 TRINITY_DN793_c0_g1_i2:4-750(-)
MAHRRRKVGIKGLSQKNSQRQSFQRVGSNLQDMQMKQIQEQLDVFKKNLEDFAQKYKKSINKNPEFRAQFQVMCTSIGVDPLASNKGFWAELLGVGDFYYHLSVQIVEICIRTRPRNGGLLEMNELLVLLNKLRGSDSQKICTDDIERAIKKIKILGDGFNVIKVGNKKLVQSVPCELSSDNTALMALAQDKFFITEAEALHTLGWSAERFHTAINILLQEGMAWIDDQASSRQFWFPSLVKKSRTLR